MGAVKGASVDLKVVRSAGAQGRHAVEKGWDERERRERWEK